MRPSLPKKAIDLIKQSLDRAFDKVKIRVMGPNYLKDKQVVIDFRPEFTLKSIIESGAKSEGAKPTENIENALLSVVDSFIERERSQAHATIVKSIETWLQNAHKNKVKTDVEAVLAGELHSILGKTISSVNTVLATETSTAKNLGALDGIVKVNQSMGIEDPVVYFSHVLDNHTCDICLDLFFLEDRRTPKCYYLSEISQGYYKKGDAFPSISGAHPHCRSAIASISAGWGFSGGSLTYVSPDHDEIRVQRSGAE